MQQPYGICDTDWYVAFQEQKIKNEFCPVLIMPYIFLFGKGFVASQIENSITFGRSKFKIIQKFYWF